MNYHDEEMLAVVCRAPQDYRLEKVKRPAAGLNDVIRGLVIWNYTSSAGSGGIGIDVTPTWRRAAATTSGRAATRR